MNTSFSLRRVALLLLALSLFTISVSRATDWPRYRGINGSGVSTDGAIPAEWTEANTLWKIDIEGAGHGSPVIHGDKLFLLTAVSDKPETEEAAPAAAKGNKKKGKKKGKGAVSYQWRTMCLEIKTGKTLWQKDFDKRTFKGHRFNSAASSTAAADSKRVIFSWGTPDQLTLVSMSHRGEVHWQKDLGPVVGGHGFAASPVLVGDLVVLNNDQEKKSGDLFALHADTGEQAWKVERKSERISYSVPCVYPTKAHGDVLVFTNWQHGFTAIHPKTGAVIADKSVFNLDTNERAISSPIIAGDLVIGTCGFTANPKHCVAMKLGSDGWKEVWRIEKNVPHIPSPIVIGEKAYLIDDSGIATCVEAATGKEIWKARMEGVEGSIFGSPVSDGTNIFVADESGNVHVLEVADEYRFVAKNKLGEPCKTTPALSAGMIFVRTEGSLRAVGNR